jgi:hypothetical protein
VSDALSAARLEWRDAGEGGESGFAADPAAVGPADQQLQTISPQVVQRWQNELESAVSHETVMACRSILFRIMEVAVKERLIPVNPVREVEAPKRPVDPDVVFGHARRPWQLSRLM